MSIELTRILANRSVSEVLVRDFPRIDKDQTISEALHLMEKHGFDRIIVTENSMPVGILTKKDLADKLLQERTRLASFSSLHVSSFASTGLVSINEAASIIEAARVMVSREISSLTVIDEGGDITGIVRKQELVKPLIEARGVKVSTLIGPAPYVATLDDRILHARQRMLENRVYVAPVVDMRKEVVGVISIDDIVDAIIDFYNTVPEKFRKEKKNQLYVGDYYRRDAVIESQTEELPRAIEKILSKELRGMVVAEAGNIVGLLTLDSVVKTMASLPSHE